MTDLDNIIKEIGFPMIVKPSISYASINISMKSVVHTPEELLEQVNLSLDASKSGSKLSDHALTEHTEEQKEQDHRNSKLLKKEQKMEFDIATPTVFVERYLAGREFTALVIGDKDWGVRVYPVAERAFDPKLGKFERLLAFDQYWDGYDLEGGSGNEDFCKYELANGAWQEHLQQVAKDAYLALDGNGYGRVDIRTVEMDSCEPVVLEVNANCGLSFEKDSSSLANILLMSNVAPPEFVRDLIDNAIHRSNRLNHTAHKLLTSRHPGVTSAHANKLEALSGGAALAITRLEGDLLHYKAAKEKLLRAIEEDIPINITLESNQRLESKVAASRVKLEEREQVVSQLQTEIGEVAEVACRDYDELHNSIIELNKMVVEMNYLENNYAELKKADDNFKGMTPEYTQQVLAKQTQELHNLHQKSDELTAEIEELKWQESRLRESNQKLTVQRNQVELQAKEAILMSALRRPELESAYKECLEATGLYQDAVGLESIQYMEETNILVLKYRVLPGSSTLHSVDPSKATSRTHAKGGRKAVFPQLSMKLHPQSGRLMSATVENAGCDVKDVIQIAKARNDISFLVGETLDRVMKAHP
ncbi:hypothetical protein EC991_008777 [Linnemannia zychae]|nr:hypothetical protein EC991_008777 [Linnemannia zychae]